MTPGQEAQTIVIPVLYDQNNNVTQMAEQRGVPISPALGATTAMLKHFSEVQQLKPGECSIFPAIRDLLANLVVPPM